MLTSDAAAEQLQGLVPKVPAVLSVVGRWGLQLVAAPDLHAYQFHAGRRAELETHLNARAES